MKLAEVSITGWNSQSSNALQVPIVRIVASVPISARIESIVHCQMKSLPCVNTIHGDYAISGILWSDGRIHATISDIELIITHGDMCIWCFIYSDKTAFSVGGRQPLFERGMHLLVDQLGDNAPLVVEEAP